MDTAASPTPELLGISGSLRSGSYNTALLRNLHRAACPHIKLDLWDGLADIPPFNEDHEHDPPTAVTGMRAAFAAADALVIATPEYNTTVPGQLKTMLDWASRPPGAGVLADKKVAVLSASVSPYGAEWSQTALRGVLAASGAQLVGEPLYLSKAHEAFDAFGTLADRDLEAALQRLVTDVEESCR